MRLNLNSIFQLSTLTSSARIRCGNSRTMEIIGNCLLHVALFECWLVGQVVCCGNFSNNLWSPQVDSPSWLTCVQHVARTSQVSMYGCVWLGVCVCLFAYQPNCRLNNAVFAVAGHPNWGSCQQQFASSEKFENIWTFLGIFGAEKGYWKVKECWYILDLNLTRIRQYFSHVVTLIGKFLGINVY